MLRLNNLTGFRGNRILISSSILPQVGALIRQIDDTGIVGADGTPLVSWTATVGAAFAGLATVRSGVNGLNSLSVAEFNGIADYMRATQSGPVAQPVTLGVVYKYISSPGTNVLVQPDPVYIDVAGSNLTANAGTDRTIAAADTNYHKLLVVLNGGSSTYALDGGAPTAFSGSPGTNGIYGATPAYEMLASYNNSGTPAFFANVRIAAYYVWNIALSSGEQTQFSAYISGKYGI